MKSKIDLLDLQSIVQVFQEDLYSLTSNAKFSFIYKNMPLSQVVGEALRYGWRLLGKIAEFSFMKNMEGVILYADGEYRVIFRYNDHTLIYVPFWD